MPHRLMAGPRILIPLVQVRILVGQLPSSIALALARGPADEGDRHVCAGFVIRGNAWLRRSASEDIGKPRSSLDRARLED